MKLTATADAYDRSVGRYARELAPRFAAFAGVERLPAGPVLDVGCGPGALTAWLAARVGAGAVAAVDPTEHFVAACSARVPGADVRVASAEALPFRDRTFQAALAQLVLPFVSDGPRAAAELARVLRPGGVAAACAFLPHGFGPTRLFWEAARRLDLAPPDDARMPYRREEEVVALFAGAGLGDVRTGEIALEVDYDGLDDLCAMFEGGVGPTGAWFLAQPPERRAAVRDGLHELLGRPRAGFALPARVVAVAGRRT
jgi:SAM-dependent methyltransferase